eukprot:2165796-Prymnesium_polylepis.1
MFPCDVLASAQTRGGVPDPVPSLDVVSLDAPLAAPRPAPACTHGARVGCKIRCIAQRRSAKL